MSSRHFQFWPRHVPHEITAPKTSLWYNVEVSATKYPDRPCLAFFDTVITYSELKKAAEQLAGFLQKECGVRRGDRVAIYAPNCPQFVIAYYAILRADAMVVPISPMSVTAELETVLADCGAKVLIAPQDLYANAQPLMGKLLTHAIVACYSDYLPAKSAFPLPEMLTAPRRAITDAGATLWSDALAKGIAPQPHLATADDLAVLPYTSGTTGKPKGCVHRHRMVMHNIATGLLWTHYHQHDCTLAVLPYFHVTGMQTSMNIPLAAGATMVILPRWNRDLAAALIRLYRVNRFSAVPTMIIDLLSSPDLARYDLSSLREVGGGGAAMPEAVMRTMKDQLGLTYLEGYGMTETMAPTHLNPPQRPKPQCLGIPSFNTDSRVVDPETLKELAPGEVGEIVCHGPQVFEGYWNDPETTEAAFVTIDGKRFLRTGDLGRMDEDGYFFFVDRLKRMINAAGFKVWPAEVESRLYSHPAVQEAVVISKLDERRGETVKALIVLKPQARGQVTAEVLTQWARENMAAYKVPRLWEFVESLPKSASGKIMWRALQERENHTSATA